MQPTAAHTARSVVCRSVGYDREAHTETAEPIEMPSFEGSRLAGPNNHGLHLVAPPGYTIELSPARRRKHVQAACRRSICSTYSTLFARGSSYTASGYQYLFYSFWGTALRCTVSFRLTADDWLSEVNTDFYSEVDTAVSRG